jgi:hypothetical protein
MEHLLRQQQLTIIPLSALRQRMRSIVDEIHDRLIASSTYIERPNEEEVRDHHSVLIDAFGQPLAGVSVIPAESVCGTVEWQEFARWWSQPELRGNGFGKEILERVMVTLGNVRAFAVTTDVKTKEKFEKQGFTSWGRAVDMPPDDHPVPQSVPKRIWNYPKDRVKAELLVRLPSN